MKLKSILTILDKPGREPTAFERAADLHERTGARIDCVAFTWSGVCESDDVFTTQQRREMCKEIVRARAVDARNMLAVRGDVGNGAHLETVWSDDIAGWVAQRLQSKPADLVVKTVQHSKTLLHTPLDWELIRHCQAPLLLTTRTGRQPSGQILATIDLRHEDQKHRRMNLKVLNAARYMAAIHDATIQVVAVTPMSQVLHDLEIIDERALARKVREKTKLRLGALLEPYKVPKRNIHQPVGKVGTQVAVVAKRLKADLIVVGTSAHRLRQAIGLGSSAEHILQHAPCDVLMINP